MGSEMKQNWNSGGGGGGGGGGGLVSRQIGPPKLVQTIPLRNEGSGEVSDRDVDRTLCS